MDDPNGEPGSIDDFEDAEKDMFVYSKPFSFLATLGGRKTSLRKVTKKYENENSEKNHYKVRKRRPRSTQIIRRGAGGGPNPAKRYSTSRKLPLRPSPMWNSSCGICKFCLLAIIIKSSSILEWNLRISSTG